jgi:hypothetical protein
MPAASALRAEKATCATGREREQIFRCSRVAYSERRHRIGASTLSTAHRPGSIYEVMNSIVALGLKSAKDLCFGRREGFVARYERQCSPTTAPSGAGSGVPFFSGDFGVGCCCTPKGPPTRRKVFPRGTASCDDTTVLLNEAS